MPNNDGKFECEFRLPFGQGGISVPSWKNIEPFTEYRDQIEITIGLSNWNRCGTVKECIESICKNNFPNLAYELIIVDDVSNDNSVSVIKKTIKMYQDNLIRFYPLKNSRTYNEHHPHNVTIKRAVGHIFIKLSADCALSKNYLEGVWRHHQKRDNLFLTCYWGCLENINKTNYEDYRQAWLNVIENSNLEEDKLENVLIHGVSETAHQGKWPVDTGASMLTKHWQEMHGFNEEIRGNNVGDVELMCRATRKGILYGYDPTLKMLHEHISTENIKRNGPGNKPKWDPSEIIKNINGYGELTEEEENLCITTQAWDNYAQNC